MRGWYSWCQCVVVVIIDFGQHGSDGAVVDVPLDVAHALPTALHSVKLSHSSTSVAAALMAVGVLPRASSLTSFHIHDVPIGHDGGRTIGTLRAALVAAPTQTSLRIVRTVVMIGTIAMIVIIVMVVVEFPRCAYVFWYHLWPQADRLFVVPCRCRVSVPFHRATDAPRSAVLVRQRDGTAGCSRRRGCPAAPVSATRAALVGAPNTRRRQFSRLHRALAVHELVNGSEAGTDASSVLPKTACPCVRTIAACVDDLQVRTRRCALPVYRYLRFILACPDVRVQR